MNSRDLDNALTAANPVDMTAGALPPLTSSEREFLGGVVAEPQEPTAAGRRRTPRRGRTFTSMGMAAVAGGACAFLLLLNSGSGPTGPAASAYAAELARIAETSPRAVVIGPAGKVGKERVFVVERQQQDLARAMARAMQPIGVATYNIQRLGPGDRVAIAAPLIWNCSELPCHRTSRDSPEVREHIRKLYRLLQRGEKTMSKGASP